MHPARALLPPHSCSARCSACLSLLQRASACPLPVVCTTSLWRGGARSMASQTRGGLCAPSTSYATAVPVHARRRTAVHRLRTRAAGDSPLALPSSDPASVPLLTAGTAQEVLLLPPPAAAGKASSAKQALLDSVLYTRRGANTTKALRGAIEEAQVAVEATAPAELDYGLLEGTWRLLFTTAPDVLPILGLDWAPLSFLPLPRPEIGNIYQRFSSVEEGRVENIIEFGVTSILDGPDGAVFTVGASYEVRSPKRIALVFEEARLGSVRISPSLETLLAPALLPRGGWNMAALMALKDLDVRFPFRSAQQVAARQAVGASYLLTYLDEDMLIGRASTPGGSFIFQRAVEPEAQAH